MVGCQDKCAIRLSAPGVFIEETSLSKASASRKDRKTFGYKVDIEHDCLDSEYSEEAYGPWSEDWSNRFRSIRRSSPGDLFPDVVAVEDFAPGESVYVVWAEWTQADSYGSARNRGIDVLGVFRTMDEARGLERLARDSDGYEPDEYMGLQYRFGDFRGYFDSLEDIHIEQALICR
jgi:hypothetical protein